jgi:enoyl-CoA hydratase/carnithine racemase
VIVTTNPAAGVLMIAIEGQRRRNVLDLGAFRALAAAWRDLEESDEARVGVVTGNGTDFCSGADLSGIAAEIAAAARGGHSLAGIWRDAHGAVLRNAAMTKRSVASGLATDLEGAYAIEDRLSREILAGPEAAEGARAFAEKRPASWRLT